MDVTLSTIMDAVRVSLCDALTEASGGTEPCFCAIVPGQQAVADYCTCQKRDGGCGMGWVRLADSYPSSEQFPNPDRGAVACTTVLAAVIEVGVFRCVPGPDRNGRAPTAAAQTQAALQQVRDAQAMAHALTCCTEVTTRPHSLGRYTPITAGDCGGGAWTVIVQLQKRTTRPARVTRP